MMALIHWKLMTRSNAPWLNIIYRGVSSSSSRSTTKQKNHYDTLETHSKATHNEIKSAYFELSKQYHPDMNNSPEAKVKFNDISSAYEILGNHSKRKQYDRGLQISPSYSNEPHVSMRKTDFKDIVEEAKRVQTELNSKHYTQADGTPIYDFDVWAQSHYGKMFERRQRDLSMHKSYIQEKKEFYNGHRSIRNEAIVILGMVAAFFTFISLDMRSENNMDSSKMISNTNNTVQNENKDIEKNDNQ